MKACDYFDHGGRVFIHVLLSPFWVLAGVFMLIGWTAHKFGWKAVTS